MFGLMFGRIVESFVKPKPDKFFLQQDVRTGRDQKFWKTKDNCPICDAPGFTCESIKNCKYF